MCKEFWIGLLFVFLGLFLVYYVYTKPENKKQVWDLKGYIGGFGLIVFGVFLIFQVLICDYCD